MGLPQDRCAKLKPCWEEFDIARLIIRTHWARMPLSSSLASMRPISDELLPALHRLSPGAGPMRVAPSRPRCLRAVCLQHVDVAE